MTEGENAVPFTATTLARLVMAYEACELAELARAAVPVGENELHRDNAVASVASALTHAGHIHLAARRFVDAAAVFARLGGADWDLVGESLGLTASTARKRFDTAETRFRGDLLGDRGDRIENAGGSRWSAYVVGEPWEAALDLDDWVRRHHDGDGDPGATPVSGGLVVVDRQGRH